MLKISRATGLVFLMVCAACGGPPQKAGDAASEAVESLEAPATDSPLPESVESIPAETIDLAQVTPDASAAPDTLDPALIGTWVNEDNLNSSGGAGGFASLSTVMTMQLSETGEVIQTTESVGGGGEWSYDSGQTIDFQGEWRANNGVLYVKGMGLTEFTPASQYSFSGDYLVTNNDQGRMIWQRSQ